MSWFSTIFGGGVTAVTKGVERVGGVFAENKEASGQRAHESDMATLEQFAAEFVARAHRSWWDSFVDGLNRLPRPLITLSVLGMFVLAPVYPVRFLEIATAYEAMPTGFWTLLSIIIAFYFGGRIQVRSQDFAVKGGALAAAKDLVEKRRAFAELQQETGGGNKVVKAWLERREG